MEEMKDRRQGERRVAEPCAHERDWIRLEQAVERHDRELKALSIDGAETKVYMKQVLESQIEIKESIRAIQTDLKERPNTSAQPAEHKPDESIAWGNTFREMAPDLVKLAIVLGIVIAFLVGAGNIVATLVGGS